jgi:hypothetical protein
MGFEPPTLALSQYTTEAGVRLEKGKIIFIFTHLGKWSFLTILYLSHNPHAIYQNVRKTLADFINLILGKNINFSNYYIFLSGINTFSPLNPRDIPESKKFQKQSRELQKPEKAFFRPKMLRQLLRGSKSSGMEVF